MLGMSLSERNYGFGTGMEERQECTPEVGFNVCEFDDFAPPGEKLTVYDHVDTYPEALKLKAKYEAQGMQIFVYPDPSKYATTTEAPINLKETEPFRLKIRDMGRFIYRNKGQFSKHQERKADHICAQLDGTVWEMNDPRRPILPSEHLGITNTHPGCQCEWQKFSIMDDDQQFFGKTLRPTKNGQPLEDLKWNNKAMQKISDVNLIIEQKFKAGTLQPLDTSNLIRETVMEIKHEFKWLSPDYIAKLKDNPLGGRFLLIRASAESITDHRSEGEPYRRKLTARELLATWRTSISKHADLNHEIKLKNPESTTVIDAEFDDERKEGQMLVHTTDDEIINAIRKHLIEAVSINAGKARKRDVECDTNECFLVPQGLVLGENDNIAFTFVVTAQKGMMYNGKFVPPARPGVKTTAIEILE